MLSRDKRIFVGGAGGMVGSAVVRALEASGFSRLLTPRSTEVDLTDQQRTHRFFRSERPDVVVLAAAKVGGILANNRYPADFIYQNMMIEANVVHAAFESGVGKLIMVGSSCVYPKQAAQPMREEELLAGYLDLTNEPYAVAKLAGTKLCESYFKQHGCNFFSLVPPNLYGPHDKFDPETSHVIASLIRKFHEAKKSHSPTVQIWGNGDARREFMHVDDLADAVLFALHEIDAYRIYDAGISHLNVGTGIDVPIIEAATIIKRISGFDGSITFDQTKPAGPMRKLLDVSRIHDLGWRHRVQLRDGLEQVYKWYAKRERTSQGAVAV